MSNIAVVFPSRGLMLSRLVEAALREATPFRHDWFFSHDKPIPECCNSLIREVMRDETFTHVWFLEEDNVPPPGTLVRLLSVDADIVGLDYYQKSKATAVSHKVLSDQLMWVSLGCTLVRTRVFATLSDPWFRIDLGVIGVFSGSGGGWKYGLAPRANQYYGGHDSAFCFIAQAAGFKVQFVDDFTMCEHIDFLKKLRESDSGTRPEQPVQE